MLPPVSLPTEKPTSAARLPAEPDVVERQRAQTQLGDQHRARLVQAMHHRRVARRHAMPERLGAVGRRNASRVEQILHAERNAVQRPAIPSRGDFGVGLPGARERDVRRLRDDAAEPGVESIDPIEIDAGEAFGGQRLLLDPARELGHGCVRDVGVGRRQRHRPGCAPHEVVACRAGALAGEHGAPTRRRGDLRLERNFSRSDAALDERRHRPLPARGRHLSLARAHRDLGEAFRLGEGGRRDGWTGDGSGAEGRRRTRRRRRRRRGVLFAGAARDGCAERPQRRGNQELSACVHGSAAANHIRTIAFTARLDPLRRVRAGGEL